MSGPATTVGSASSRALRGLSSGADVLLVGAAPGTGAQGGGSLAALADGGVSLLGQPRAPILTGGAQPLPGLPQALSGLPASNSSLWQMAAIE